MLRTPPEIVSGTLRLSAWATDAIERVAVKQAARAVVFISITPFWVCAGSTIGRKHGASCCDPPQWSQCRNVKGLEAYCALATLAAFEAADTSLAHMCSWPLRCLCIRMLTFSAP